MSPFPTILAVASPGGRSLRGIVRVSGAGTWDLLAAHVAPPADARRRLALSRLRLDGGFEVPVTAIWFRGPRSYTGEDGAELQLPGNPALLEAVVDGLIGSASRRMIAARRAEPGEFTARAYLARRMDLAEAEGVAATIAARSDAQLRAAALLRRGRLGALAAMLAGELSALLALVEAAIDFSDQEDVVAIAPGALLERLEATGRRLDEILDRAVGAERLEAIPWVVLTGPPNAGKSTLFNALLGRRRAVVSPEPGTTRDVLVEPLAIRTPAGPAEVMLVDAAGDEAPGASRLTELAQEAAGAARSRAELLIRCVPADGPEPPGRPANGPGTIVVRTRSDLARGVPAPRRPRRRGELAVSARTGAGLGRLRRAIAKRVGASAVSLAADAISLQARHEAALRDARGHVQEAIEAVASAGTRRHLRDPELVAAAVRAALDEVGAIAGRVTPDDVLGRIFASFCIGK